MHFLTKATLGAAGLAAAAALGSCGEYGTGVAVGYQASWGDPYWGWYGDYYYPGTGIYVYDTNHRRHRWNDDQRRYWEGRRNGWRGDRHWRHHRWEPRHH